MSEFETITIPALPDLTLAIGTFLEGSNADQKSGKFTAAQLASFLAPYVSAVGSSGYVAAVGSTLPTPTGDPKFSIIFKGVYSQGSGDNINATGDLNVVTYNGTTWALTASLDLEQEQYLTSSSQNLFNPAAAIDGQYINSIGVIGSGGTGYKASSYIDIQEKTKYTLFGLTSGGEPYSVRIENEAGDLIQFHNPTTFPFEFTSPEGSVRIKFTCKVPADSIIPAGASLSLTENIIISNGLPLQADRLREGSVFSYGTPVASLDDIPVQDLSQDLFNYSNVVQNQAVDSAGDIQSYPGYATSGYIDVDPLTGYVVYGIADSDPADRVYSVRFENSLNQLIGVVNMYSFPYRLTTPAGTERLKYTIKDEADAVMPTNLKFIIAITNFIEGKDAPLAAGVLAPDAQFRRTPLSVSVGQSPAVGKKIVLYGDSIITENSPGYFAYLLPGLMQQKTGAVTVTRRGQSGQSIAGALQSDANLAAAVSDLPDFVVIECVNDHRSSTPIGTKSSPLGEGSVAGGLKKIFNAFIQANKNVKIVLCTPPVYGTVAGFTPPPVASNEVNTIGNYMTDYREMFINIAAMYGVNICDLSTDCGFRPQIEGTSERVYTHDGVHENEAGYEVLTTLISRSINKIA